MSTDIMVVSWKNDLGYLKYCLKSINKFATGFNRVVLVVAEEEERLFRPFQSDVVLKTYPRVRDPILFHLHHQAIKCQADKFCEADFILHTDSDCVFTEPVTPDDYMADGKPIMLIEEYSRLNGNPWQKVTENVLGFQPKWECMRRHPQVNPRGVYQQLRAHIVLTHGMPFEIFVLSQKPDFVWGFSEHNAIGAIALHDDYWKNQYHWIDLARQSRPRDKLAQFWSHSPINKAQDLPSGGRSTPLELYSKIGLC